MSTQHYFQQRSPSDAAVELRELRLRAGMTQAQLAGRADCSLSMVTGIEGGAVPRRSAVVERLRAVLAAAIEDRNDDDPAGNRVDVRAEGVTAPNVEL